jgi:GntR family transcriptional regulator, transcriptional repressor for pyruvate dehydrogenase complex
VGRSSLREAIKTLRALGVVDVVNGNGMFVGRGGASLGSKPLSWGLLMRESGARELIEGRRLVESELAALAAERATDDEMEVIGRLATAEPEEGDAEAYGRAAIDFHHAVASAAHNTVLSYFFEGLQHILRDWISQTYEAHPDEARVPNEHVPVYEAIRARDAARAREVMARHLDAAGSRLLRLLSESERSGNGHARSARLSWTRPGPYAE